MITGLHHVQLAIPEGAEDRARAFYGGTQLGGLKRFYSADPFGNRLEFLERASFPEGGSPG